jgi:hypothetical protein
MFDALRLGFFFTLVRRLLRRCFEIFANDGSDFEIELKSQTANQLAEKSRQLRRISAPARSQLDTRTLLRELIEPGAHKTDLGLGSRTLERRFELVAGAARDRELLNQAIQPCDVWHEALVQRNSRLRSWTQFSCHAGEYRLKRALRQTAPLLAANAPRPHLSRFLNGWRIP